MRTWSALILILVVALASAVPGAGAAYAGADVRIVFYVA